MKQFVLAIVLALFITGCKSTSFDDTTYVWEDWDIEQQSR